jgi:hypothetical protein
MSLAAQTAAFFKEIGAIDKTHRSKNRAQFTADGVDPKDNSPETDEEPWVHTEIDSEPEIILGRNPG